MKIQLFGVLSDTMKKKEILIPDVKNTVSLKEKIRKEFPQLGNQSFVIAVNKKAAIWIVEYYFSDFLKTQIISEIHTSWRAVRIEPYIKISFSRPVSLAYELFQDLDRFPIDVCDDFVAIHHSVSCATESACQESRCIFAFFESTIVVIFAIGNHADVENIPVSRKIELLLSCGIQYFAQAMFTSIW